MDKFDANPILVNINKLKLYLLSMEILEDWNLNWRGGRGHGLKNLRIHHQNLRIHHQNSPFLVS
jgi:hypothetical protein